MFQNIHDERCGRHCSAFSIFRGYKLVVSALNAALLKLLVYGDGAVFKIYPIPLEAEYFSAVEIGATAGCVQAVVDGRVVAEAELIWSEAVEEMPREKKGWLQRMFGG